MQSLKYLFYLTACFVKAFIGYGNIVAQIKLSIVIMLLIYNFTDVQSYPNDDCNGNKIIKESSVQTAWVRGKLIQNCLP